MTGKLPLLRTVAIIAVPLLLFSFLWLFLNSGSTADFSLAVTIDVLFVIPVVYFLLIRKTSIPNITVVPVLLIGFLFGMTYLPADQHSYLELFKLWVLPLVEVGVILIIGLKLRTAILSFKRFQHSSPDFFTVLKQVSSDIVPKPLVVPFATEIAVFYYGLISWKQRALHENEFSYHKKSGSQAIMFGIVMIIAVETYVLHILLMKWSETAAYIVSFLSIYTGLQFIGFAKSLSKRPITITSDSLILRYGMVNETKVPFDKIESIEVSTSELKQDKLTKRFSLLGELEPHNVLLSLKGVHEFNSMYGIKRKFKTLALFVDEAEEFVHSINNRTSA